MNFSELADRRLVIRAKDVPNSDNGTYKVVSSVLTKTASFTSYLLEVAGGVLPSPALLEAVELTDKNVNKQDMQCTYDGALTLYRRSADRFI